VAIPPALVLLETTDNAITGDVTGGMVNDLAGMQTSAPVQPGSQSHGSL
jgi:hypothetical protein